MLLSPDAVDGGGAQTTTMDNPGAEVFGTPEGATTEDGGDANDNEEEQDRSTGLSKDDITEILKSAGVGQPAPHQPVAAVQPQAQQPQMSQEEFNRTFNIWQPDAAFDTMLRAETPEQRMQAYAQLRDSLMRQAMTVAEYRMQQLVKEFRDKDLKEVRDSMEPLNSYVSEQRAVAFEKDFFEKYPDLEQYRAIVDGVVAKLQGQGFTAATREKVMERFATDSRAVVKQLTGQQASPNGGNGRGQQAKPAGRQMSTLTGGGHVSGRSNATDGGKKLPGIEVFD